jgi:prefoldin alpha subunit
MFMIDEQELMIKFQMFEQKIQQTQQQMQVVEQALGDLNLIDSGLNDLSGAEGKEIMAPIGRGIFAKTKLLSEELLVDIGDKTFVGKSIEETQKMIKGQTKKLDEVKNQLEEIMEEINSDLTKIMIEAQKSSTACCGEHEDCECDGKCKKK